MQTKTKQIIKDIVKVPIFLPFILILRIVSKFRQIRFKCLTVTRIGHQASEFFLYCIEKEWDILPKSAPIDLFYHYDKPANSYLMSLIKRKIPHLRFVWFIRTLHYCNRFIKGFENNEMSWAYNNLADRNMLSAHSSPLFTLKAFEVKKGEQLLKDHFNCDPHEPIICFFNRDGAYLKSDSGFKDTDYSYHDYRDSAIKNYQHGLLQSSFADKYIFFRLGKVVEESLIEPPKNMIDYANSPYKCDFLDIYIMARSKFIVCALTGLNEIGTILQKKMAIVNVCPLLSPSPNANSISFGPSMVGNLVIFKKYYSTKQRRYLNLTEILALKAQFFYLTEEYKANGIQLIENTAEEIRQLADEMEMRMNHEWEETPEDKDYQNKFWNLVGVSTKSLYRDCFPKIGSIFLKSNPWLLQ